MGRLEDLAYNKFLLFKRIYHLVSSEKFSITAKNSDYSDYEELETLIQEGDIKNLKTWLNDNYIVNLSDQSIHDLRILASKLRIKNYSRQGKEKLVKKVKKTLDEMVNEMSPYVGKRSQKRLQRLKETNPTLLAELYDYYLPVKELVYRMSQINMNPEDYETKGCTDYHEYQSYYRLLMILRKEVNNAKVQNQSGEVQ